MAQVLAKYNSLPSAERDKLSPVFAGVHVQRVMHAPPCVCHAHVQHVHAHVTCTCSIHAPRMGPLHAGILQEKATATAAAPPRVWPSEVHTYMELEIGI